MGSMWRTSPGRAPAARDWLRDRDTFAPALGGEWARDGFGPSAGLAEGEEDGEKVGNGEVE